LLDGGETIAVNLASGRGASVREVIERACAVTGAKIDARKSPRRAGDPPILMAQAKRAQELLGWSAERSDLATIITDAWRWHKNRFGNAQSLRQASSPQSMIPSTRTERRE
jgi:UDP-glucose 4-epimerase